MSRVDQPRIALALMLVVATALFAYALLRERSLIAVAGESTARLAREGAAAKAGGASPHGIATGATETAAHRASETAATRAGEPPAQRAAGTEGSGAGETATGRTRNAGTTTRRQAVSSAPAPRATAGHVETAAEHAREGHVLGVNLESPAMIVLAILVGVGLAVVVVSPVSRTGAILLALALAALAWSALDVREVVHQASESRTSLTIVAGLVAGLHAAAAGLAVWLAHRASVAGPKGPSLHPPAG